MLPLPNCACSDRDDFIAEAEKIRPLNTYHSSSSSDPVHLQHEPVSSGSLPEPSSPLGSGYQQYLRQQQQLLQAPHQQQQQEQHQLPVDSWAGLMSESTLNNLEELLRANGGGSSSSSGGGGGRRRGNWDEDWVGPSISDEEAPGRSRMMSRITGWLERRAKRKQKRLRQHLREEEQLKVEQQLLQQAELQEQQRKEYERHWR